MVGRLNQRPDTGYPEMDPATRAVLGEEFARANAGLEDLVRRPLPVWG